METSTGGEKHVVVFIDVVDRPEVEASAVVAINRVSDLMEYFPTQKKLLSVTFRWINKPVQSGLKCRQASPNALAICLRLAADEADSAAKVRPPA